MSVTNLNPGTLVVAEYKSGVYVGELLSADGPMAKVRMLAVLKHPTQGDLHNPMQSDVPFFHQRRALAYREVANVPLGYVERYDGKEAPDYKTSLKEALERETAACEVLGTPFGDRCVAELRQLAKEYFP
ncbi:sporulation phosphorelay system protein KapB [Paenibacillus alkalitolerans]|uniref:sporulation phosphorelay system protein KapB n=1 Tax=Paenibacillus alkalitolerans TaxID=2799335 RepID=UPI0018F78FDB|nr:sporulation phosphorelay system protein KapB [Paenibacillus alkalitolerans]